jgi:hypothetical protein
MVGRIVSIVEVGTTVGGTLVEIGVAVGSITGAGAGVQAVRRNKMTMNFFIAANYMSLRGGALRQAQCKLRDDEAISWYLVHTH